ncbi:uncharacterized protein L3040_005559 [Drepanopeziza brunnea f. sp. 'multigermtubi']|uniref:uncharacterized protein n=1 Tax=Drepanopeziza brunnea f. sp. 'multigermtubi' TaxID=698441 RepID=UPI0023982625|nr:hypothetical protein L3040_005559 [Drepanopeziza brunnea f. sp. 'multigermtubi']
MCPGGSEHCHWLVKLASFGHQLFRNAYQCLLSAMPKLSTKYEVCLVPLFVTLLLSSPSENESNIPAKASPSLGFS